MNTDRLIYLAEWLENGAQHERIEFNMSTGVQYTTPRPLGEMTEAEINACGTSCCIAGATTQFFGDPEKLLAKYLDGLGLMERTYAGAYNTHEVDWEHVACEAQKLLGLTIEQATILFDPTGEEVTVEGKAYRRLSDFNDPAWAARVIRKLIETGDVDWEGTHASNLGAAA